MNTQPVRNLIKRKPSRADCSPAKINFYKKRKEDRFLMDTAKGHRHLNQRTRTMLEAEITIQVTRCESHHGQAGSYSRFSASLLSHEPVDDIHSSDHKAVEISCNSLSFLCHIIISSFISVSPQMLKFKN
ncbi:hypothetical protein Peur_010901 [Populus x canadensis]